MVGKSCPKEYGVQIALAHIWNTFAEADEAKNFKRSRAVEDRIQAKLKTIEANNAAERAKLAAEEKATSCPLALLF